MPKAFVEVKYVVEVFTVVVRRFAHLFDLDQIEDDFAKGLKGIKRLPLEARFGVFMAYRYYNKLLQKLKNTPALEIKSARIRVPNYKKIELLTRSYVKYQLNLL